MYLFIQLSRISLCSWFCIYFCAPYCLCIVRLDRTRVRCKRFTNTLLHYISSLAEHYNDDESFIYCIYIYQYNLPVKLFDKLLLNLHGNNNNNKTTTTNKKQNKTNKQTNKQLQQKYGKHSTERQGFLHKVTIHAHDLFGFCPVFSRSVQTIATRVL